MPLSRGGIMLNRKTIFFVFSFYLVGFGTAVAQQNVCGINLPANAVWKFDHFPGSAVLPKSIDGAPNFREVDTDPVYGTAQPTVAAVAEILRKTGADEHRVLWINLREEPFLYINGRPYALRDPQHPFKNLAGVASVAAETQQTETCLENELRNQAAQNGGMVDLYDETADGKLVGKAEELGSVETVDEVFMDMGRQGYKIDFHRIPVEDEKAPTSEALQVLLSVYANKPTNEPLVANCQGGKGRTTTALAIYYISRGLDPDTSIDKVGAAQNLRTLIEKQKDPQKKQDFQQRYDLLKLLPEVLKSKAPSVKGPDVNIPAPETINFD